MRVEPGFMQCFDVKYIAEQMLRNRERFSLWQLKYLRKSYRPDQLSVPMRNFLNGVSSRDLYPKRGRPPAVLTSKELTRRVGIMIDYPLFLAEERERGRLMPKLEGTARERACERIAAKYSFRRALRTLLDSMTKWRKDEIFMRILHRHEARLMRAADLKKSPQ